MNNVLKKTIKYAGIGLGKNIVNDFKPDIVISSSTYPLDTYPAQKIARLTKCKYIHEGHDIWPLTLIEVGGMKENHPFVKLLAKAEESAYKNADKVVSVLPNSVEHMLSHGLQNKKKFEWIPNGIVASDWENIDTLNSKTMSTIVKLRNRGHFIIGYVGGYGVANGIDTLIDAASCIRDTINIDVSFVLIGKREIFLNQTELKLL